MEIKFDSPRLVRKIPERIIPEKVFDTTGFTITQMIDNPVDKTVKIVFDKDPFFMIIWSGDSYDTIGQWTDEDVITKLNELFLPVTGKT